MQSPPPQLDPVAAATAIFAIVFSPTIAAYVGPYAVIIIGAALGAAWSLGRRPVTSRYGAIKYFLLIVGTALLFTVPAAEGLRSVFGARIPDVQLLFAPIALLIGGVGTDWPKLIAWMWARLWRIFEHRTGVDKGDK